MNLILIFKVLILGIVEGITEWLPISSTGHLILVGNLLDLGMSEEFTEMFNVVIQLGAIMAVVVLYFRKLWPFHSPSHTPERSWFANPQTRGAAGGFQRFANRWLYMDKIVMWLKIAVSCIPAVIVGLTLDDWLEAHLYKPVPVAVMLIFYGVLFILIERRNKTRKPKIRRIRDITWTYALLVGVFQALAVIPGTSRSGATIIGGILIGMSRTLAAEYTFYLAIPTMLGASLLKVLKFGLGFTSVELIVLLLGMAVAFIISILAIKFLMGYIKKHDFTVFGWYRIVLGVIVILMVFFHIGLSGGSAAASLGAEHTTTVSSSAETTASSETAVIASSVTAASETTETADASISASSSTETADASAAVTASTETVVSSSAAASETADVSSASENTTSSVAATSENAASSSAAAAAADKKESAGFMKYLITFLVSMVPVVELRGAIPIAVGMGVKLLPAYILAVIGNMIPVPFIFFFARKFLVWGSKKKKVGKAFQFFLRKGESGGKKLQSTAGRGLYFALLLFVGIPLPGTGAWTGTLAASILDMDFKKSVIAVMGGVLLAGIIMGLISAGVFTAIRA